MKTKIINGREYTHRTRKAGYPARIICNDCLGSGTPILALVLFQNSEGRDFETMYAFREGLEMLTTGLHDFDLVEGVEPEIDWSSVPIDTPVWCVDSSGGIEKRHYAGVDAGGSPLAWWGGKTSHTTSDRPSAWAEMHLTDPGAAK